MGYRFTYNPSWKIKGTQIMRKGLVRMLSDIHQQAVLNAPKKNRVLINSGRFKMESGLKGKVTFRMLNVVSMRTSFTRPPASI